MLAVEIVSRDRTILFRRFRLLLRLRSYRTLFSSVSIQRQTTKFAQEADIVCGNNVEISVSEIYKISVSVHFEFVGQVTQALTVIADKAVTKISAFPQFVMNQVMTIFMLCCQLKKHKGRKIVMTFFLVGNLCRKKSLHGNTAQFKVILSSIISVEVRYF